VITIYQRYRQTDRQTTCDRNTALCTKVHRAVKKQNKKTYKYAPVTIIQTIKYKKYTMSTQMWFKCR